MNRNQGFIVIGCLIFCLVALIGLYTISPLSKEIKRNSFDRLFAQEPVLVQKGVLDLEYNSFYIAGTTNENIYLGNSTAPFHLLVTSLSLADTQHIMLKVKLDSIKEPRRFKLAIDSPYFFLAHGTMPELLRGEIGHWEASRFMPDSADYFEEVVPMSPTSFAFRSYSLKAKGYELARKSVSMPFRFEFDLLQKQIDGIFCVDGQLHYNKTLNRLVYLYYYRNEFIVADSNLNLVYRGHTIDTFNRAHIKVAQIGDKNQSMLSRPPMQINGLSSISERHLFVQSNLLSNNEDIEDFINNSVIDVYYLKDGSYVCSFYINTYKASKPLGFEVFGNYLAAIFDHYLVLFELNTNAFPTELTLKPGMGF